MMPIRRHRLAAALSSSLLAVLPLAAAAQQPPAPAPQARTLDTVQVTGTRIRKAEMETAVPVQVLTREDIQRSGFTSVADIVQNLTASGAALNTKFNSSGNFGFPPDGGGVGAGAATVDLRHLGAKRVLVLVDGIRWVNESSASGVGSAVDLNTIPLSLIERIEVLEDGASSIYGSDAIAGVVNIITRRDADGGSLDLHYGEYDDLGGATWGADLGWGGHSERAQWFFGASYYKQRQIASTKFDNASVRCRARGWPTAVRQHPRVALCSAIPTPVRISTSRPTMARPHRSTTPARPAARGPTTSIASAPPTATTSPPTTCC